VSLVLIAAAGTFVVTQGDGLVDDERLRSAGSGDEANWITYGRDLGGARFSRLDQITPDTVSRLAPVWIYQMGTPGVTQTHPLVVDGVMYVTSAGSDVAALDAATGRPVWRYRHTMARPVSGERNRGAAVGYGMVFVATEDERVVALDQATGEVAWDVRVLPFDPAHLVAPGTAVPDPMPFNFRWAPLVYDGKVIVTATRFEVNEVDDALLAAAVAEGRDPGAAWIEANLGRRAFVAALDASSGEEVWRWYTTREDDWTGDFVATAPDGSPLDRDLDAERELAERYALGWASGSSSPWQIPTVDVERGLIFVSTGNPAPGHIDLMRPGDNLYSNGVAALDLATGELRWFFQESPHGLYDMTTQNVLFDLPSGGGAVPALASCGKSGFCYVLHRETGEMLVQSEAVVRQENMHARGDADGVRAAPGGLGGVGVSALSFDPTTGYLYVEGIDQPHVRTLEPVEGAEHLLQLRTQNVQGEARGTVTALDLFDGGRIVWQVETPQTITGGTLATAGGVVFSGETNGLFDAYDAATGELLWSFQVGGPITAPPMTYAVGGRQFVAIASGGPATAAQPGGAIVVAFALPD
jgi:alcohol dehydrogenase (cytochrome c)